MIKLKHVNSMFRNLFTLGRSIAISATLLLFATGIPSFRTQTPPTAVEDEIFTYDNIFATGSLAENDLNPSGSQLSYQILSSTNFGDLVVNNDGSWTFNPYSDVAAVNQLMQYQVCDQNGQCDIGDVWLYVQFQNNAPEPEDDFLFVEINEPRFGDVSSNDFDPDYLSDPISTINSYSIISQPSNGDIIFNLDGTFQYTPDPNFTGNDSFTYLNCDACAVCAIATVFVTVIPTNDEPVANSSGLIAVNEDTSYSGSVADLTFDPDNDLLVHSALLQPEHGDVIMNQDGSFIYVPDNDYFGSDEFMYLVCDIVGQCAVGFVYFNVINQNDPPITTSSSFMTNEDFPAFIGNASTGDSDDSGVISYSLIQQSANGITTLNSNGSFTYTPYPNFYGYDTLFIQACDLNNACVPDYVYFTISPLNDWPVAIADDFFGYEDEVLAGTVANDTDVDGDVLAYTILSNGVGGNLVIDSDGDFTFTPNQNFSGFSIATYQVCDPNNACSQGTLTLEIIEINDDPIINADFFTGPEDEDLSGNVLTNDIEPDGEIIYYFTTSNPQHGTIIFNAAGSFTYTPEPNWSGQEVIQFYGCDPCAVCLQSTLTITIEPVNDPPVTSNASFNLQEDISFNGSLAAYATDLDDSNLLFALETAAENGLVVLQSNGIFNYTPFSNFNGTDSFEVSICDDENACQTAVVNMNVLPVNDAPTAVGAFFNTNEDVQLNGILQNDYDPDGDQIIYSIINAPMNGTITMQPNGEFIYIPETNYNGVDFVTYEVCDEQGLCDATILEIEISPVNDAPLVSNSSNVTYQNDPLNGDLTLVASDPDGDDLTYSLISAASEGSFILNSNGQYTYYPDLDYSGPDEVTFEVCDNLNSCSIATLSINVFTTNTAPSASEVTESIDEDQTMSDDLSNYVSDNEGGVLTFFVTTPPGNGTLELDANGNFNYTPDENYFGEDSFSFQVCDTGNMCDEGQVDIEIASVNDYPAIFNESVELNEDTDMSGDLSTNDSDADGDALVYSVSTGTASGFLELASTGEFSYTPSPDFFGTLSITYSVCDINGACTNGQLTILVNSINDQPLAQNLELFTEEDQPTSGDLQTLANDVDYNFLYFNIVDLPENGILSLNPNGQFVFMPDSDFSGSDSFVFNVCDDDNACSQGIVSIGIASINDAPAAGNDFRIINEDHTANGNVGLNDIDIDSETLTFNLLNEPDFGILDFDSEGNFVYTPFENEWGDEELMIEVCDEFAACDTSFLYIQINPVNDPPAAMNMEATTNEDILLIGDLILSVNDPDNDELTFNIESIPTLGVLSINESGGFVYTPNENIFGIETIEYTVCDGSNECSQAQLIITILSVNDAPNAVGELIHVLEDSVEENTVAMNDYDADGDELTYVLLTGPAHGDFILQPNGEFVYTPLLNYWGSDQVDYMVCDAQNLCSEATLVLEVDFVNDAPILFDEAIQVLMNQTVSGSVASNDIELDSEQLTYFIYDDNSNGIFTLNEDGTYEYTPYTDVSGTFTLTYYACDPCAVCSEGTITIYVVPEKEANTPPTAIDNNNNICHGASVDIDMLSLINDAEEPATDLIIEFSEVSSGSLTFDSETKILTYQSDPDNDDPISVTYTVCDNGVFQMCTVASINFNILSDIIPIINDSIITDVLCFGQNTGSIDINVSPAVNIEYDWSNGSDSQDINSLSPGNYSVTVSGEGDCFVDQTFNFAVGGPSEALNATVISFEQINDSGNGSINIDIEGGTPPYDITWIGPNGFLSTEEDIIDLVNEGTYAANINDDNGCSTTVNASITGIENQAALFDVIISPNPCTDNLNIDLKSYNLDNAHYRLYDSVGQLIMSDKIVGHRSTIGLQELASGCYWIMIGNDSSEKTLPVIKQ